MGRREGLKDYLVQSSHFTGQTNGTRKVQCLPNLPARGGNCLPGQFLLVSSLSARMGERIGADCSGLRPNYYRTLITVSATEAEACTFCSRGTWLLPAVAKVLVRGLLVASKTPYLPQVS